MARYIDGELTEFQYLTKGLRIRMHPTQQRPGTSNQLTGRERLHQVIICSQLKTDDAVFHFALRREHDDGHIRGVPDDAADAFAGDGRQHQVKDDEIEAVLGEFIQRLLTVPHSRYPVAFFL
jgi:hypothetical protein